MTEAAVVIEQARTHGYLGFQGKPRAFGASELKADDVKLIAGEVGHDDRVKTMLIRNLDIPIKSMQFLSDIITVTPSISNILLYQNQFAWEGAKTFSEALAHNSTVTKLNIGMNFFPVSHIFEGIASCKSLTELDFSYLEMSEGTTLDDFTKAMENNTTVSRMTLFSNNFTERHGEKIGQMLNTIKGLTKVDLSVNELGDEGMDDICQALKVNTHLKSLTMGANGLTSCCGKSVEELLLKNTTLTSLNLIDNKIGAEGVIHMANALRINSTLQNLNLNKNYLGTSGITALANGIRDNHGLKYLNLNPLPTSPQPGARQGLFDMMASNTTLSCLNIGINPLGEELICSVCNGASVSKTLTSLNLQRVNFDTERANEALCRMLEKNNSLTSLSLAHCRFSDKIWPEFFRCLKNNTCLMDLSLRCVLNRSERIALLRDYLCTNPSLESINLCDNNIRAEECTMIADIIRQNSHLTSMNVDSNCVTVEGGKLIIAALEENHTLVDLFHRNSYIGNESYARMNELIERNKACVRPSIETFLYGVQYDDKSPVSLLRDVPVLTKFISQLALPGWHPQNVIDQVFSD